MTSCNGELIDLDIGDFRPALVTYKSRDREEGYRQRGRVSGELYWGES